MTTEALGAKLTCLEWPDLTVAVAFATPKHDACDHNFQGWRDFPDGAGGERVCAKCGMGAMAYTLASDW